MIELATMALCVTAGMLLSYITWAVLTNSGERSTERRCLLCGSKRRSYFG